MQISDCKHQRILSGIMSILLVAWLFVPMSVWAESVELVTYYPSLIVQDDLDAGGLTIGDGHAQHTSVDGVLTVEERIGIGTTDPEVALDIYKEDEAFIRVMGTGIAAAPENYSGLDLSADMNVDGEEDAVWQLVHKRGGAGNEGDFHINRYDNFPGYGGGWRTALVVQPDGDVGIGLSGLQPTPSATLDVGGNVHVYGDTSLEGNTTIEGDLSVTGEILDVVLKETTSRTHGVIAQQKHLGPPYGTVYRTLLHTFARRHYDNLFLGYDSGNFTMGTETPMNGQQMKFGGLNIGIGTRALSSLTDGYENVAFGHQALNRLRTGSHNVALGHFALGFLSQGHFNTSAGEHAFVRMDQSTSSYNTGVGYGIGRWVHGFSNTFVGYEAAGRGVGGNVTGVNENVAVGVHAMNNVGNNASGNVAIGTRALADIRSASRNTALGFEAGQMVGQGGSNNDGNVFLGNQAGRRWTGANKLFISNDEEDFAVLILGDFAEDHVKIRGNLGIGQEPLLDPVAGTSGRSTLSLAVGTAPTTSPENIVQLFAQDVSNSAELQVRDEAGNVTTLSPHNFSLIPGGSSEPLAWSYYSEKNGQAINIDMLKTMRLIETLSGETLVYLKQSESLTQEQPQVIPSTKTLGQNSYALEQDLEALLSDNEALLKSLKEQADVRR